MWRGDLLPRIETGEDGLFGGFQVALVAGVVHAAAVVTPLVSRVVRRLPHGQGRNYPVDGGAATSTPPEPVAT